MKTNETTSRFTRRGALGLVLAGVSLPVSESKAAARETIYVRWLLVAHPTTMVTCSGESITASFESELLVGSDGAVKGFMRFTIATDVIEYVGERGGLDFDSAGAPIRALVLLSRRGSSGKDAHDFLLATVAPVPVDPVDCLIYTTVGSDVHVEPVRFEVPGTWEVR